MLVIVSGAVPTLDTVTGCTTLAWFNGERNVSVVGEAERVGAVPVPLSATDACGVPTSEVLTTSEALRRPIAEGAKRTRTVQLRPDASVVPHWLFNVKSAAFAPLKTILLMVRTLVPALPSVTVHDVLEVPPVTLANETAAGLNDTAVPIPLSGTVNTGITGSEVAIASMPILGPLAAGVKLTLRAQLESTGKTAPQEPGADANSEAFAPLTEMLLIRSGASPPLNRTRVCGALVVAMTCTPNVRDAGRIEATGAMPVPLSKTLWVDTRALSVTTRVPVLAPLAIGLKATWIIQFAPDASVVPQVVVWLKSPGLIPAKAMLEIDIGASPELVSVTVWKLLIVLTIWLEKFNAVGARFALGAVPVPLSATDWVTAGAMAATVSVADRVPVAVGAKVMLALQLAPTARVAPQV